LTGEDDGWEGKSLEEAAMYELQVGTFGPDGKVDGVEKRLGHLGVTAMESMPLSGSPGRSNRMALLPDGALLHGLCVVLLTFGS